MENEKRGISQITGKTEIKLGEKTFYKVTRIHRKEDHDKVKNALWKLYVKEKGSWRELKPNPSAPLKKGDEIPLTITNQSLVGKELLVEAYIYEPEIKAPPGLKIKVVAGGEKKIHRVELFMVDDTPIKENTVLKYNQTIKVKVYTQNMPRELLKLTLYEDDADGGGHNQKNEKNKVAEAKKATNDKGFLWYEFKLNADFSKIANAMMDGSSDKLHEYYVLVESVKYGKKESKNVEVENPDYVKVQTVSSSQEPEKTYGETVIEEVVVKGKYKKQVGIDPMPKTGRSVSIVSEPPEKKEDKEKCFCNRDFEEKDVRQFVKLLKGKESIWDWKNCDISDKSFSKLTAELNQVFKTYHINTCTRKMHFLSQICEETGVFGLSEEGKSKYKSSVSKYKGRGLLQLTGVKGENSDYYDEPGPYQDYANYISDQSVVKTPTIVATDVHYCIDSGGWIWSINKKAPKFVEGKKDSQATKDKKKRLREKYKEILGKTPNEIADFVDKYQLEVGKVINGFHENSDPINQPTRKLYYDLLKNSFFEYRKYHENIQDEEKEKIKDEIVTYHIFSNGDIEKHIPKEIKSGYESQYRYVYHDSKDEEHDICTVDWHLTKEKSNGQKPGVKPTHSKIISDNQVSDGQTTRRIKYQNGDIAEYGSNDGKSFWVLYRVTGKDIELVKMPDLLDYNEDGIVIKYSFTKTKRRYTEPGHLAVFIGALAECGFTDVQTTGSCFSEASCFPSVEHVNGKSIDTLYLDDTREQKLINAFNKFGITKQLRGSKKKAFTHTTDGKALHNSHLHSGIISADKIKIIKEE